MRLANLAAVAGVHPDDPMFMALLDRRFQLGDHDYANGIAPDLKWTPERMETWVKALRPDLRRPALPGPLPRAGDRSRRAGARRLCATPRPRSCRPSPRSRPASSTARVATA
ncbi:MAG: hypothetical protein U0168_20715 [Nannocystaceae bacterium]